MNKLLIGLCAFFIGYTAYSNASVIVNVTEEVFDQIVEGYLTSDPYVVVIEKGPQAIQGRMPAQARYNYITFKDGFYYNTQARGRKTFDNPNITVMPAESVTADHQNPHFF